MKFSIGNILKRAKPSGFNIGVNQSGKLSLGIRGKGYNVGTTIDPKSIKKSTVSSALSIKK